MEIEEDQEVTVKELGEKIDALGAQMDWLCENLASLFTFASQMSNSGGGLRGLLSVLKSNTPALTVMEGTKEDA